MPQLTAHLDGRAVRRVTSFLTTRGQEEAPSVLRSNHEVAVIGSFVLGIGFVFEDGNPDATPLERMRLLIDSGPKNIEAIRKYVGGEDLNSSPSQTSDRFIIDFGERDADVASLNFPELFAIVEARVKPARASVQQRDRREEWWRHATRSPVLRRYFEGHERALAISQVTAHMAFSFVRRDVVLSHTCVAILLDRDSAFAVLQSRIHESWARLHSSSLETRLRYTPSDCLETFPFPTVDPGAVVPELEVIGKRIYDARGAYMLAARQGLTQTYNALKDASVGDARVAELRSLHEELDRAVLAAYGWSDIAVPPFVVLETDDAKKRLESFEDEVIDRLFVLNAGRAAEEAKSGLGAAKKRPKAAVKKTSGEPKISKTRATTRVDKSSEQEDLDLE